MESHFVFFHIQRRVEGIFISCLEKAGIAAPRNVCVTHQHLPQLRYEYSKDRFYLTRIKDLLLVLWEFVYLFVCAAGCPVALDSTSFSFAAVHIKAHGMLVYFILLYYQQTR